MNRQTPVLPLIANSRDERRQCLLDKSLQAVGEQRRFHFALQCGYVTILQSGKYSTNEPQHGSREFIVNLVDANLLKIFQRQINNFSRAVPAVNQRLDDSKTLNVFRRVETLTPMAIQIPPLMATSNSPTLSPA